MNSARTFIATKEATKDMRRRKMNKSRVTLLVGCTASGKKLPLMALEKDKNPQWPKPANSKKVAKPPIDYVGRGKGWMTGKTFGDILVKLEKKCTCTKKLLLLDNCSAHKGFTEQYDGKKTSLRMLMLLANTISRLQLCNKDVICSLKSKY